MQATGPTGATYAESARNSDIVEAGYPKPPDLDIEAWSSLIGSKSVTSPHLIANIDHPSQSSSDNSEDSSIASVQSCRDFYRRASWAPDGSAILAITESQRKHVHRCSSSGGIERTSELKNPSPLLDAVWYPVPALRQPTDDQESQGTATTTWCFAESHRDLPIRLTASNNGESRASYSIMNHVEKFVGPHSLAFSPDLSRLYCGLFSALAVFPLSRPGLNTHANVPLTSGKRSTGGQKGIISAVATTAHPSDASQELVAVGTYNGSVGIYGFDPTTLPDPTEHTATQTTSYGEETLAQSSCLAGWREIEGDGITQLKFHPLVPYVLFVASRRSDYMYVYDARYLMGDTSRWSFRPLAQAAAGVRTAHLLAKLRRSGGASHQRLHFDVDWAGRWLATGDENGMIHLWRIDTGRFMDQADLDEEASEVLELKPDLSWKAHADAVGSVSFHPYQPWLVSVSGSRRWSDSESANGRESSSEESESTCASQQPAWTTNDSSLKVWDFSQPPAPRC
ncbi:related to Guanine nucleotide-binding protein beta 5 [Ustilago trichophora]|uniref:Related to Guanine nucleotide-binding protein beta 5 n=1 Tax=Ustilago trichophora TaxID=86804 RepID=A0A5C3EFG6_9BASI|nr:related to Guanine nucleotide-binding protein beta 5 [Ustilago trichophora]